MMAPAPRTIPTSTPAVSPARRIRDAWRRRIGIPKGYGGMETESSRWCKGVVKDVIQRDRPPTGEERGDHRPLGDRLLRDAVDEGGGDELEPEADLAAQRRDQLAVA